MDPALRAATLRVLQVVMDGQLGRHLASELGSGAAAGGGGNPPAPMLLPLSHVPLVLVALVHATSTDSSRVHFSDRVKHNLRKVKALEHLVALARLRYLDLRALLLRPPEGPRQQAAEADQGAAGASPADAPPGAGKTSQKQQSHAEAAAPSPSAAGKISGRLPKAASPASVPAAGIVDVWDFLCNEDCDEDPQKASDAPRSQSQQGVASAPSSNRRPEGASATAEDLEAEACRQAAAAAAQKVDRLMCELRLCIVALENATFACVENEDEVLRLKVRPEGTVNGGGDDGASSVPFSSLLVSLLHLLTPCLDPASASPVSSSSPSPAARCLHSAVGLLMNLTHQHEQGVAAVVEAGALGVLAELLLQACCGDGGHTGARAASSSAAAADRSSCNKSTILHHLDLVTVCFGLLINITSLHPVNRELLRRVTLPAAALSRGSEERRDDGGSITMVSLLCSIFNAMAFDSEHEPQGGVASARADDHSEVTAEELQSGHQMGEAAIVQVRRNAHTSPCVAKHGLIYSVNRPTRRYCWAFWSSTRARRGTRPAGCSEAEAWTPWRRPSNDA